MSYDSCKIIVSNTVDIIHDTTEEVSVDLGHVKEQEQMNRIMKWLSACDPSTNYNKALEQRLEGTGLWFVHGSAFGQWKQQLSSLLWLHGIPGCGKTVLSSTTIEHLKQNPTCRVLLYFYFDFSNTQKQTLDDPLRSLTRQLSHERPDVRQDLCQFWSSHSYGITS
jgi:predicted ATPase